jgi:hypothetical protein
MLILKGSIIGVADKGTPEKPWHLVAIQAQSLNRNGFIETTLFELGVFGESAKQGLHNAYRAIIGTEVYAPVTVSYNEKYKELGYQLAGIPLRIAEQRPVQSQPTPAQKAS